MKNLRLKDLTKVVSTTKTELLFLPLFLRLLKIGGRSAVIVPDGVLFGSSKAHKAIRKTLIENHKLDGVISMPSGVFKPYAGVSTAVIIFTKVGVEKADGRGLGTAAFEWEASHSKAALAFPREATRSRRRYGFCLVLRHESRWFIPR